MKRFLPALLMVLASTAFGAPPAPASAPASTANPDLQQQMSALQSQMNTLAARMAALSANLGDEANATALRYLANDKRGMLGIAASRGRDGLRVEAVTPGGPAERAGLQTGDVITAIDGKRLSPNDSYALADLQPGKTARLTVIRDGKTLHFNATPERFQTNDWQATVRAAERAAHDATARVNSPEFQQHLRQQIDHAMHAASQARTVAIEAGSRAGAWNVMAPWWGLNLAPLNPDLGRYFGTDEGALVLSREAKRYPKLQPGDVITRVGARPVANPQDALRAFRDSPEDKPVAVTVRRHGKTMALAFKS
ncbi:MAG: PDZ domain-containing protein, partial [Rhodanobacteraceae bacterium]